MTNPIPPCPETAYANGLRDWASDFSDYGANTAASILREAANRYDALDAENKRLKAELDKRLAPDPRVAVLGDVAKYAAMFIDAVFDKADDVLPLDDVRILVDLNEALAQLSAVTPMIAAQRGDVV